MYILTNQLCTPARMHLSLLVLVHWQGGLAQPVYMRSFLIQCKLSALNARVFAPPRHSRPSEEAEAEFVASLAAGGVCLRSLESCALLCTYDIVLAVVRVCMVWTNLCAAS